MDGLSARLGIWTTRFGPHLAALRGIALVAGYANLHVVTVATQVALR